MPCRSLLGSALDAHRISGIENGWIYMSKETFTDTVHLLVKLKPTINMHGFSFLEVKLICKCHKCSLDIVFTVDI